MLIIINNNNNNNKYLHSAFLWNNSKRCIWSWPSIEFIIKIPRLQRVNITISAVAEFNYILESFHLISAFPLDDKTLIRLTEFKGHEPFNETCLYLHPWIHLQIWRTKSRYEYEWNKMNSKHIFSTFVIIVIIK